MAATVTRPCAVQGGWSLVDCMVATSFVGLLATVLHGFTTTSLHVVNVRQVADDLDESAHIALQIIARDLREAGYGLPDAADRGLRGAEPMHVQIARDLDFDGATSSSNERVAYRLHPETGQLRRQLGAAGAQPMVDDVVSERPLFRYFDADGAELLGDDGALDTAQRASIRRIEITLQLTAPNPAPGAHGHIAAQHRTSVTLRNGIH